MRAPNLSPGLTGSLPLRFWCQNCMLRGCLSNLHCNQDLLESKIRNNIKQYYAVVSLRSWNNKLKHYLYSTILPVEFTHILSETELKIVAQFTKLPIGSYYRPTVLYQLCRLGIDFLVRWKDRQVWMYMYYVNGSSNHLLWIWCL